MAIWFSCKIKYQKQSENGKVTNHNEQYLVDAMSFTEAEARLYFELGSSIPDFTLTNISKMNLQDLFHFDDCEIWYKCKVVYISVDEKSGKEKKVVNTMLVSAINAKQAYERVEESLSTMIVPFEITDVNLTPILEIFPYIEDDKPKKKEPVKFASGYDDDIIANHPNIDLETGELLVDDASEPVAEADVLEEEDIIAEADVLEEEDVELEELGSEDLQDMEVMSEEEMDEDSIS